ncbi:ATP-utilizing chromatin assembly and remodelling N-terminal-domain-containing protein [Mucor mucedo]|uniref:ATP-utilizing chromatin assembly and remodelling N-terminal-domain-containing protein n=1 Tax=Mucor mucedo TaxID=29922 RepID=UPI0022210A78|nr:ATP-utilizing chromatin assembly and remodelling N-terminal-domain-containing protein [Mucor mucedo]KAI7880498.1 ATP-utilizing chromatin assembly and remodelling N-terminal-domain-containing protein [Mucor mucedo]
MPLLKRKRFAAIETPTYDADKKESRESTVWYLPLTKEIFKDYSEYLKRASLYRKPIWQCESTGKSNLTLGQALESEKIEKERVQDKLPEELQKRVLLHVQFQTLRLDAIVEDVYKYFAHRYVDGEILNCIWDDNIAYTAKVLSEVDPSQIDAQVVDEKNDVHYYKVQLIDENAEGIDDCIKVVPSSKLKRDRLAFSKNLLKKFIKEYTIKDSYIGAPWIIRQDTADRFGIDTTLPKDLQLARDIAYSKSRKKRTEAIVAASTASTESLDDPRLLLDAKKVESTLKYPMEDLNVPIYRRDPSGSGPIMDMTPGTKGHTQLAPNPTGGLPPRPQPNRESSIPKDAYGPFLMVWSFLGVFSHPLKLSPFSLDDFENALRHHSPTTILIESNIALLNAIITQRDRLKKESLGHGSTALQAMTSLYGSGYQSCRSSQSHPFQQGGEEEEEGDVLMKSRVQPRKTTTERGCGSAPVEAISLNWDHGTVDTYDERLGWEDILIGFINQLAPMEMMDDVDRILSLLVPRVASTSDERERAYINLSLGDKIKVFELLLSVANESHVIKSYMEECQDQMTELRKQKIELSRERKRIHAERREMEDKQTEESNQNPDPIESDSDSDDDSNASDNDEASNLRKAQRKAEQLSRHESRQATLKRRQAEMKEREAKRLKQHHLQREEARVRNQEQKQRADARRRLDEDERAMHKKEEHVERDMRKYSNHRIKPLGRDKFYNRYYYLDDIGGTLVHGSGKLFVQCPSDTDLMVIWERDFEASPDATVSLPCGRGGGVKFVTQLLVEQGMRPEAEYMENRLESLYKAGGNTTNEWWQSYDEPEQLQSLLEWLNPKGIREFRLKRELEKQIHNLTNGMKKRVADQIVSNKHETARRNTRSKAAPQFPPGSWLAYTNKLA